MFGVFCLSAALVGLSATDQMSWRSREVAGVRADGTTLDALVATLAVRTRTPIHLVYEGEGAEAVIRGLEVDLKTNLGRIFDRVAEQVPGIRAVPTERGVIWICPIRRLVRRPLEAEFELPEFAGPLDDLMSECFLANVHGISNGWSHPAHDPQRKKVDLKKAAHRTSLEVAVAGFEQNQACLQMRLTWEPPQPEADPNALPLPQMAYSLVPLRD